MAISPVQRADYASSAKATSHAVPWSSPTTPGNLLLLYVDWNEEGVVTNVTVPAGFVAAVGPVEHQSPANPQLKGALYYRKNAPSQSGNVTVTLDSAHHCRLHIEEYSGADTTAPLDTTAQNHGSSTTLDSGTTGTTAGTADLMVGLLACKNVNAETIVASAGWSQTSEVGQASGGGAAGRSGTYRKIATGAGTSNVQATISASADWVGMTATFKAAGSAAALVEWTSMGAATTPAILGGVGNRTNSNNDALAGSMNKYPNIHLGCFYAKMATIEPSAPSSITNGTYQWGSQSSLTGMRGAIQNARTHGKRLILRFEWGYGVAAWMFTTSIQPCTEVFLIDPNTRNTSAGASSSNLHSPLPWTSSGDGTPNPALVAHYTRFLRALNAELLLSDGHGGVQADHVYHVAVSMPTMFPGTEQSLGYGQATPYNGAYDGPSANVGSSPTIKSINLAEQNRYGTETNRRVWYLDAWDAGAALHMTYLPSVPSSIAYGTSFGSYSAQPGRAKALVASYGKRICHMITDLKVSSVSGTYAEADPGGGALLAAVKSVNGWVGAQAEVESKLPGSNPKNAAIKQMTDDALAKYGITFFEPADPLLGDTYAAATDGSGWQGIEDLQSRIEAQGGTGSATGGFAVTVQTPAAPFAVVTASQFANIRDSFTRTVGAGSLGTAEIGEAWTISGTAGDYSVNGSAAVVAVTAANQTKTATQADAALTDCHAFAQFQIDTLPAGAVTNYDLLARYVDANNFYRCRAQMTTGGQIKLRLDSVLAGATTNLTAAILVPGVTVQAANDYSLLFAAVGTNPTALFAYLWDSSSPPPSPIPWVLGEIDDSSAALQVAAAIGFACSLNTGSTAAPTVFTVADSSFFPVRWTGEADSVTSTPDAPFLTGGKSVPPGQGTRKIQTPRS